MKDSKQCEPEIKNKLPIRVKLTALIHRKYGCPEQLPNQSGYKEPPVT